MDNTTIYRPAYIRVIERRVNGWAFRHGEPFINLYNAPWLSQKDLYATWDTSMKKVAIELFTINGGAQGYYLENSVSLICYILQCETREKRRNIHSTPPNSPTPLPT